VERDKYNKLKSLKPKKIEEGNKRYSAIAAPVKTGRPLRKDCVPSSSI